MSAKLQRLQTVALMLPATIFDQVSYPLKFESLQYIIMQCRWLNKCYNCLTGAAGQDHTPTCPTYQHSLHTLKQVSVYYT